MNGVTISYKLVTSNPSNVKTSGASTSSGSGQGTANLISKGTNLGNRTGKTYSLSDKAASEKAKQGAAARAGGSNQVNQLALAQKQVVQLNESAIRSGSANRYTITQDNQGNISINVIRPDNSIQAQTTPSNSQRPTGYEGDTRTPQQKAFEDKALATRAQELQYKERFGLKQEGVERVEKFTSFVTFGGGKPIEERSFVGKAVQSAATGASLLLVPKTYTDVGVTTLFAIKKAGLQREANMLGGEYAILAGQQRQQAKAFVGTQRAQIVGQAALGAAFTPKPATRATAGLLEERRPFVSEKTKGNVIERVLPKDTSPKPLPNPTRPSSTYSSSLKLSIADDSAAIALKQTTPKNIQSAIESISSSVKKRTADNPKPLSRIDKAIADYGEPIVIDTKRSSSGSFPSTEALVSFKRYAQNKEVLSQANMAETFNYNLYPRSGELRTTKGLTASDVVSNKFEPIYPLKKIYKVTEKPQFILEGENKIFTGKKTIEKELVYVSDTNAKITGALYKKTGKILTPEQYGRVVEQASKQSSKADPFLKGLRDKTVPEKSFKMLFEGKKGQSRLAPLETIKETFSKGEEKVGRKKLKVFGEEDFFVKRRGAEAFFDEVKPSVKEIALPKISFAQTPKSSLVPITAIASEQDQKSISSQISSSDSAVIQKQSQSSYILSSVGKGASVASFVGLTSVPLLTTTGGGSKRKEPFSFGGFGLPSGGLGGSYGREGRGSKQKYAYTPSLTGIEKRVVGSGKATGNTGISVRGVSKKQLAILEGRGKSFVRF